MTAQPNPTIDYIAKLNELTLEGQPEGANGWVLVRDIIINDLEYDPDMVEGNETFQSLSRIGLAGLETGSWDNAKFQPYIEELESHRSLIRKLDAIRSFPKFQIPYPYKGESVFDSTENGIQQPLWDVLLFDAYGPIRRLCITNKYLMRAAANRGDYDDVVERFSTSLLLSDALARHPLAIDQLVALAIKSDVFTELTRLLNEFKFPLDALESLIAMVEAFDRPISTSANRWLRGEQLVAFDCAQWSHSTRLFGAEFILVDQFEILTGGGLFGPGLPVELEVFRNIGSLFFTGRQKHDVEAEQAYLELSEIIELPRREFHDSARVLYSKYERSPFQMESSLRSLVGAIDVIRWRETYFHGVRVMLFIERHYAIHGEWPGTLVVAMSEVDARDPISGREYHYEFVGERANQRPYVLSMPWNLNNGSDPEINAIRPGFDEAGLEILESENSEVVP
jgi:hypothetical protein